MSEVVTHQPPDPGPEPAPGPVTTGSVVVDDVVGDELVVELVGAAADVVGAAVVVVDAVSVVVGSDVVAADEVDPAVVDGTAVSVADGAIVVTDPGVGSDSTDPPDVITIARKTTTARAAVTPSAASVARFARAESVDSARTAGP